MWRNILGAAVGTLLTAPALACLNDTQTALAEKEFRSRYEQPAPQQQHLLIMGLRPQGLAAATLGAAAAMAGAARILRRKGAPR